MATKDFNEHIEFSTQQKMSWWYVIYIIDMYSYTYGTAYTVDNYNRHLPVPYACSLSLTCLASLLFDEGSNRNLSTPILLVYHDSRPRW